VRDRASGGLAERRGHPGFLLRLVDENFPDSGFIQARTAVASAARHDEELESARNLGLL
jgi:hypothetical protein